MIEPITKHCTQVKLGFFAQKSATVQAESPTVEAIERSMWRITTIGAIPIASNATTEVEVRRSLVPSPVKNRGLINPVPPTATTKIIKRLDSRLDGRSFFKKFILSTSLSSSSCGNYLFLGCLFTR